MTIMFYYNANEILNILYNTCNIYITIFMKVPILLVET